MKIIEKFKGIFEIFWVEHLTFPLRMAIVFIVVRYFFIETFILKNELITAAEYLFIFFLIYTITAVINLKTANSSPFFVSDFIEKNIKDDYLMRDVLTLNEKRGVYIRRLQVDGTNVISTFVLHENPEFIKGRASAFSLVLQSMQLPSHEKTINRLDKIVEEADFMLNTN